MNLTRRASANPKPSVRVVAVMGNSLQLHNVGFKIMGSNNMGPDNITSPVLVSQIASALRGDTSLQSLDIGGNNIGPQGITAVAEALRGNENLTTLELGYNPIGEAGAKALASVIKYDLKVHTSACPTPPEDSQ